MISFSRSTTSLSATDCTLPAESPLWTFLPSMGDSSKPTSLSSTRLACWASTRLRSMSRGFSTALSIASRVISWKTILLVLSLSSPRVSLRCQAMASPSRSSSDASQTVFADFAACLSSETTFFLSAGIMYSGLNPCSMSTLSLLSCRSRMCPKLDLTSKSFPKNF